MSYYHVFLILSFGLTATYYVFTKLLAKYWHGQGLRTLVYLDDGIVAVAGKENAEKTNLKVSK